MKIPSHTTYIIKPQTYSDNLINQQTNPNYQTSISLSMPSYNVLFNGFSPKYFKAQAYLDTVKQRLGGFEKNATDVYKMDLNKLDGIQEGIKVFDGLNFKEIAFIARSLTSIAINRGCSNLCSYCYAEAKLPQKETDEFINKMSWNDFNAITDGFNELNNRLGFYLSAPNERDLFKYYSTAFHDSDCMELVLKDNENKEHDFIDIAEKIYDSTGVLTLFDTSGWNPQNQFMQQRAEKYVKCFSNRDNMMKIAGFNVSLNPFHILNTKSVIEKRAGNIEKSEKLQNLYIKRMANMFFSFTPLLKKGYLGIIYKAVPNSGNSNEFEGFKKSDLDNLTEKILSELKKMYIEDLNSEQKYITNKKQINDYIHKIRHITRENFQKFTLTGRGIETFGKNNSYYEYTKDKINTFNQTFKECTNPIDLLKEKIVGVLDANGNYYLTTYWSTYPTELKLNFENKNKKTAPINPALQEDLVIKKNVINNHNI